jgi:hypothetical protein
MSTVILHKNKLITYTVVAAILGFLVGGLGGFAIGKHAGRDNFRGGRMGPGMMGGQWGEREYRKDDRWGRGPWGNATNTSTNTQMQTPNDTNISEDGTVEVQVNSSTSVNNLLR